MGEPRSNRPRTCRLEYRFDRLLPDKLAQVYQLGSSEEIVGGVGFGQLAKRVIEGEFEDAIGAEAVGFSHSDFGLVVQALHDAAGK